MLLLLGRWSGQKTDFLFLSFRETLTEDKGIHDDPRDGCSNHKAKGNVDVEIRGESRPDPKDSLDSQVDENDDPATVPGTRRDISELSFHVNNTLKCKT